MPELADDAARLKAASDSRRPPAAKPPSPGPTTPDTARAGPVVRETGKRDPAAPDEPPPAPRSTWFTPRRAASDTAGIGRHAEARAKARETRKALPKGRNFH